MKIFGQTIAAEEGIFYQTLISSIIHKYVSGRLAEKRVSLDLDFLHRM